MTKTGWLINDCLTCIPNTKTFWHFLLDSFPSIEDKTGGYTAFASLPEVIERQLSDKKPDFLIRNATFFRPIQTQVPTISLLQDPYEEGTGIFRQQIEVCNSSSHVVFNSDYTKNRYEKFINKPSSVIPIGTDSKLFAPKAQRKNKNTIIYVGSSNESFKGFSMIRALIEKTNYNFILVMKDGFDVIHPRVRVYNSITQEQIVSLMAEADVLVCTSKHETLHLAGIEAMFCDVPVVANDVGIYSTLKEQKNWGKVVDNYDVECYYKTINDVIKSDFLSPRHLMFENGLSLESCYESWKNLIEDL